MKIALINWTDTCIHGDQTSVTADDKDLRPIEGVSSGLLVKQDGEGITIALDYFAADNTFRNAVTYSQKQIKSYSILEVRSK